MLRRPVRHEKKDIRTLIEAFLEIGSMKNVIYAGVIVVCILVAALVFMKTRQAGSPLGDVPDSEMIWVKCIKCGQGYQMSLKQFAKEGAEKAAANAKGIPMAPLLKCEKCGQDGLVKAYKCPQCGEIFREGSIIGDLPDRCPKCKHSETEAIRAARRQQQQQ